MTDAMERSAMQPPSLMQLRAPHRRLRPPRMEERAKRSTNLAVALFDGDTPML